LVSTSEDRVRVAEGQERRTSEGMLAELFKWEDTNRTLENRNFEVIHVVSPNKK
jgi:hypothetical protein